MTTVKMIYQAIDDVAPFRAAMDYDNTGILVGNPQRQVRRVMLCLDITANVVLEAAGKNVDLILSHHPVIFQPFHSLSDRDIPYMLAQHGIAALCCHTNLDVAPEVGVNAALGKRLMLRYVHRELSCCEGFHTFSGEMDQAMEPRAFAQYVKQKLSAEQIVFHAGKAPVKKVCFCSGAGGDYLSDAVESGAQAYITGELKHHEMIEAQRLPITVIAAGHYETEQGFADCLLPYLQKSFPELGFIHAKTEKPPMEYV